MQEGKDPALSLLCGFDPWPGNSLMLRVQPKKKKPNQKNPKHTNPLPNEFCSCEIAHINRYVNASITFPQDHYKFLST